MIIRSPGRTGQHVAITRARRILHEGDALGWNPASNSEGGEGFVAVGVI